MEVWKFTLYSENLIQLLNPRNQWIRFGYDPRKDPEAKMFQTLDYRLRVRGSGARHHVSSKRKSIVLSRNKISNSSRAKVSYIDLNEDYTSAGKEPTDAETIEREEKMKDTYMFRPKRMPPSRQIFYQYKNILVPEAQQVIKSHEATGMIIL